MYSVNYLNLHKLNKLNKNYKMGIDKIMKLMVPKDKIFYPLLKQDVANLISISESLILLMQTENNEKRLEVIKTIKQQEKIGDNFTHQIFDELNKSFITPFDREDIHQLASTIDDVADSINKVAQRIKLYNPKRLMPSYLQMSQVIYDSVKQLNFLINELEFVKNPKVIKDACDIVSVLEHKSDDIYHESIQDLFNNEKDPIELIKNKEILEALEKTADKTEDVSDVIKTILVKTT